MGSPLDDFMISRIKFPHIKYIGRKKKTQKVMGSNSRPDIASISTCLIAATKLKQITRKKKSLGTLKYK